MSADAYIQKAERALSAAQILLANGEIEGACNRAYYAMFDAAHAALLRSAIKTQETSSKTHRSLIGSFGLHLVKNNQIASEFGRAINEVERLRRLADYTGDPLTLDEATWAVEQAEAFVQEIRNKFIPKIEPDARTDKDDKIQSPILKPKH